MMWQCHLSAQDYRYYPVDGYSLLKRLPLHPLTGLRCPVQTVGQWLENIGLPQYENHLLANGFDNVQFMVRILLCIAVYRHCGCFFCLFSLSLCLCFLCDLKYFRTILLCTEIW
uniref:SAM domain-containing protein n=1 Tax=Chelonoidis abingdonii TaxID=106734 RepID=A0A8C0GKJ3_CHEAB